MTKPIQIGTRREMFVDDYLIESLEGAALRLAHPERREVVFVGDAPWEDTTCGALSLVQTAESVRFYYRAAIPDMKDESVAIIAMAESKDGGVSFQRPDLGLVEFKGSRHNNILWHGGTPGVPVSFLDTKPGCPPEARFKGLCAKWAQIGAMSSADGLRWRPMHEGWLKMDGTFDTINTAFWDSMKGCYRSYTRMFTDPATGAPYPKDAINWQQAVRAIQTSTSPDFINWTPVQPLQYRDGDVVTQMYTNDIIPCPGAEHIYVGFPNRYIPERGDVQNAPFCGMNDALFMCSRDGVTWTRYREAWVRPGLDQRNWTQRNNYPAWGIIRTSDEEWSMLISDHYMQPDKSPCRFRRLSIRPWGFVSIAAGYSGGEVVTRPLIFGGKELRLNYSTSAAGSIAVEIRDEQGKPIDGFCPGDAAPLYGDRLDGVVTWKTGGDLSRLAGRPVRFRFVLKDADIFALRTA